MHVAILVAHTEICEFEFIGNYWTYRNRILYNVILDHYMLYYTKIMLFC